MRGATGRVGAAIVASWVMAALFACNGMRQDELDCEEAVAVLDHCCNAFPSSFVNCTYEAPGCGAPAVYPSISTPESQCIRAESCSALVTSGVCDRAAALSGLDSAQTDASPTAPVCP
ncbi:MAG TPA: hypothetical protein VGG39_19730 [Polyangiaceae bacterium]|jgi:hypothetical protein